MPFRDIKFRDYCPKSNTIRYFDLDRYDKYENDSFGNATQFLEIQDKNGVDIYEGDFIKIDIIEEDNLFDIYVITLKSLLDPRLTLIQTSMNYKRNDIGKVFRLEACDIRKFKVVGNIYENKKLFDRDVNIFCLMDSKGF